VRLFTIPRTPARRTKPSNDFPQTGDVAHAKHAKASFGFR
jgi:hypothetical protein